MIDVEGVRSIFSNPFEFLLFSEIWTTPDEQFEAISTEERRGDDDWFLFRGEVFL